MLTFFMPKKYKEGLSLYKIGRYQESIKILKEFLKENPSHADGYFKLGMCYFKLKTWDEAYEYIKIATSLAPKKTEWQVQLKQSENKLKLVQENLKKKLAVPTKKAAVPTKKMPYVSEYVKTYQEWLICRDTLALDKLFSFQKLLMESDKNINLTDRERDIILILQAEQSIAEKRLDELSLIVTNLINNGSIKTADYYRIILKYLNADYLSVIDEIYGFIYKWENSASINYILTSTVCMLAPNDFSAWSDIVWTQLSENSKKSKRQITWRYLATLTKTPLQSAKLIDLWKNSKDAGMVQSTSTAAYYFMIDGLVQGNTPTLAKQIAIDYFKTVKSSKKLDKFTKKTIQYSVEDFHPEWFVAFANIDASLFLENSERFKFVLKRVGIIFSTESLKIFCIRKTLLAVLNNDLIVASSDIELGVIGLRSLNEVEQIMKASGEFLATVCRDINSLRFKHFSGVTVCIHAHQNSTDGAFYIHEHNGVLFKNNIFDLTPFEFEETILYVPDNKDVYLNEFFFNWKNVNKDFDVTLNSKNIDKIFNKDILVTRLYQKLSQFILQGNNSQERNCQQRLKELGETELLGKYYKHVSGCNIRDLSDIHQYNPEVVLYLSGLENVGYQGNMWIPVLERLDVRSAIVIREERIAEQLIPCEIPVYFMNNMRELELLESSGVRTILYPANTQKNVQTLRFFNLNHFFINHGESDKVVNQSKFLMAYDRLLVAGPLAEQRLYDAGLPVRSGQVIHVGRPQVELMLNRECNYPRIIRNILYAPTWEGFVAEANYSSVNQYGMDMLKKLSSLENVHVYFKPHPYTGYNKQGKNGFFLKEMISYAINHGMTVVDSGAPIFDYMNQSDLMITDISSVLNDYLYTWKPMILTNPQQKAESELHQEYPSTPAAYILHDPRNILRLLESIESLDPLLENRKAVCLYSLGDISEGSMVRFNKIIMDSVKTDG